MSLSTTPPLPSSSWPRLQRAVENATLPSASDRWRRMMPWRAHRSDVFPAGIYVFAFHSVVDPDHAEPWERAYDKVAITVGAFRSTLECLAARFAPLRLSDALTLAGRDVDRPYAVITFDDGYVNTLTQAAPVAAQLGFEPTLFVNARFAEGGVYYRVLAALLSASGHAAVLAEELRRAVPTTAWSVDPTTLFNQTKDAYVRGAVEQAVDAAYRRAMGDPRQLNVHVNAEQAQALATGGWEIGNHTYGHDVLCGLSADAVSDVIESNERFWGERGVALLPCVAYPNGAAKHVGDGVAEYLERRRDLHGMFCNGGVNLRAERTEWLRIPVSAAFTSAPERVIAEQVARTRQATQVVQRAAS